MRCSTAKPSSVKASAIRRRWQRHHTVSAHMIASASPALARSSSSARALWNSGVDMWALYAAKAGERQPLSATVGPVADRRPPSASPHDS